MRIGGEAGSVVQFVTEIGQLLRRETAFKESAGIDARRGMALEIDKVARELVGAG